MILNIINILLAVAASFVIMFLIMFVLWYLVIAHEGEVKCPHCKKWVMYRGYKGQDCELCNNYIDLED